MLLLLMGCPNTPPSAPGVDLLPDAPLTSDELSATITVDPIDADPRDELTLEYRWTVDGEEQDDLDGPTVPASRTAKGQEWTARVRADDGRDPGPWASDTVTIGNTPPTLTLAVDPQSPRSDQVLTANTSAHDEDGDDLSQQVTWAVDGAVAHVGPTLAPGLTTRGDTWTVTATAEDGEDLAVESVDVEIGNALPTLTLALAPEEPLTVDPLTAQVATEDADGDPVELYVSWFVDGVEIVAAQDSLSLDATQTWKGAVIEVFVTPYDGVESGAQASASVTVANHVPTVDSARVSPTPVREESVVSCLAGGFEDWDGDPEGAHPVRWLVDGVEVATSETLDGTFFDKGQGVACALTPTDGEGFGAEVLSNEVPVKNTPPDVSGATLTIGPSDPQEADVLTYTLAGSIVDVDGDSWDERLRWEVDGVLADDGEELTGAHFDKGQDIQLVLTAWDGDLSDELPSNTVTGANTPPVLQSASFTEDLYTRSTASLTVVSTDVDPADQPTHTYAWLVEGTSAGTGATLDGDTWFDRGDVVTVTVTPTDGTDPGASATLTATVLNTPPSAPVVTIDPASPAIGDELWCELTTASTDDDGDTIDYTFAWTVDSVAFTAAATAVYAGDLVEEGEAAASEEWTCTVVPDDGQDSGDAGQDTVVVDGCWEEVYSDPLNNTPPGGALVDGGWGGHSFTSVGGVPCMWQSSDWNYAYIPVTRSSKVYEKVEVDVYYSSGTNTHRSFNFYGWGDRYGLNYVKNGLWFNQGSSQASISGGNTYNSSSNLWSSSPVVSTGTWVTLSWVANTSTSRVDFYVDGVKEASNMNANSTMLSGGSVVLRSGGQAYSAGGNTCWANLAVYEADTDATCTR